MFPFRQDSRQETRKEIRSQRRARAEEVQSPEQNGYNEAKRLRGPPQVDSPPFPMAKELLQMFLLLRRFPRTERPQSTPNHTHERRRQTQSHEKLLGADSIRGRVESSVQTVSSNNHRFLQTHRPFNRSTQHAFQ